jgi:hypothetical protein
MPHREWSTGCEREGEQTYSLTINYLHSKSTSNNIFSKLAIKPPKKGDVDNLWIKRIGYRKVFITLVWKTVLSLFSPLSNLIFFITPALKGVQKINLLSSNGGLG